MKKLDIALAIGMAAALLVGNFNAFAGKCEKLEDSILRLHIIANSDSRQDQEVKLEIRDAILEEYSEKLDGKNLDEAITLASENLNGIEETANRILAEKGFDYRADAKLTSMYFNTRYYDNYTTPAGQYTAVRITLGEGAGKNWWCVLYPSLCLGTAVDDECAQTFDGFDNKTAQKPEYVAKFKVIELFESAKDFLNGIFKNT